MNYAAMSIERLTDNVPFRMAILGPSPPYEYPVDDLVERVEEVVANMVEKHDEVRQHQEVEQASKQVIR